MGANQSVDPSHDRIWHNLSGIQNPATRAQMLETLLSSPEYVASAKRMGIYATVLQWLAAYRRGEVYAWPYQSQQQPRVQQQRQQQPQQRQQYQQNQIIEHPIPRKAHDYFTECCDLLGIDETSPLSSEVIRTAYRKAAGRAHPDRGGDPELFDAITRASAYLQKIVDRVSGIRQQAALVNAPVPQTQEQLQIYSDQRAVSVATIQDRPPVALSPKNLNMQLFNQLFDENKLPDPEKDDGYGDWLKASGTDDSVRDNPTLRKKFALDTFNKAFESETGSSGGKRNPAYPSAITLQPTLGITLGGEKPPDYTAPYGGRGVQYTDLRSAYTSESTFSQNVASAANSISGRPSNLKDMERARSGPLEMSPDEKLRVQAYESQQQSAENQRVRRMAQQDEMANQYHTNLQRRLLVNT
jgi:curved DNA-binding protein CbpA